MIFVFYHIDAYKEMLKEVLLHYGRDKGLKVEFYSIADDISGNQVVKDSCKEKEYIIFYRISKPFDAKRLWKAMKKYKIKAKLVALCLNYQEGILAVSNGSDYALCLPLQADKIIQCCEFCASKINKI